MSRGVASAAAVVVCSVMAVGCGPRSWMTQLVDPAAYQATERDDYDFAVLEQQRTTARSYPLPENAVAYTSTLINDIKRGLPERREKLGEPLDVMAHAGDAAQALSVAAGSSTEQAPALFASEAQLWQTLKQPARARAAAQRSFQAQPNFTAFRILTKELKGDLGAQGPVRDELCTAIRPRVRYVPEVPREQGEEVALEITDFIDTCRGVCGRTAPDSPSQGYKMCDWVSDKEAYYYRMTKRFLHEAEDDAEREQAARTQAETDAFFRESCYRRCDQSYTTCHDSETSCMASRRACGGECDRSRH